MTPGGGQSHEATVNAKLKKELSLNKYLSMIIYNGFIITLVKHLLTNCLRFIWSSSSLVHNGLKRTKLIAV